MRRMSVHSFGASFSVTVVPTLQDNFSYIIHDAGTNTLAAVDVNADTTPVLRCLRDLGALSAASSSTTTSTEHGERAAARLRYILTTHKHWDHAGGNESLVRDVHAACGQANRADTDNNADAGIEVVCGAKDRVAGATRLCRDGDALSVGDLRVTVHDVPCHTRGHVMYTVQHTRHRDAGTAVFTGDTVFVAGLGAFFEGDAADMVRAMRRLYHVNDHPDNRSGSDDGGVGSRDATTFIFPGHEYTVNFVAFAERMLREKGMTEEATRVAAELQRYKADVQAGKPTVPSTLAQEKLHNLFLRVVDPAFRQRMGYSSASDGNSSSNNDDDDDAVKLMTYLYNACD